MCGAKSPKHVFCQAVGVVDPTAVYTLTCVHVTSTVFAAHTVIVRWITITDIAMKRASRYWGGNNKSDNCRRDIASTVSKFHLDWLVG
jgi:hypothetical protein